MTQAKKIKLELSDDDNDEEISTTADDFNNKSENEVKCGIKQTVNSNIERFYGVIKKRYHLNQDTILGTR